MHYFLGFLFSLIGTLILTPVIRRIAIANKIVDQPGGRRINTEPIPRMGGIAIVVSFWLIVFGASLIFPNFMNFSGVKILCIDKNLIGVFLGSMILMTAGVLDDIRGLSPLAKLTAQILAAICIPLFGIHIQWLAHPFGGPDIHLSRIVDGTIAVIWIVTVINVINWLDGLDGLAAGVSGIASLILFFLSLAAFVNQPMTAMLAIILCGACVGFLRYNINPAKIFMGDSGSMFLGFILAVLAIISGGKLATAGLVLGIPILDAAWVILRRLLSGKAPWSADRGHLHHRLLDAGLSQKQTVFFYWVLSAVFGGIALASRTYGKTIALESMVALMIVISLGLIVTEKVKRGARNGERETF